MINNEKDFNHVFNLIILKILQSHVFLNLNTHIHLIKFHAKFFSRSHPFQLKYGSFIKNLLVIFIYLVF